MAINPFSMLRSGRRIQGISAILLPFQTDGSIDFRGFANHVLRTAHASLVPAINMDTGFGNLIEDRTKTELLRETNHILGGKPFVAGAFVGDQPGQSFNRDGYLRQIEPIVANGGIPVLFQSYGLTGQPDAELIASYAEIGRHCDRFIAFELGSMFAPFGKIYSLDAYRGLLGIPQCIGAKHSSLKRELEWQRIVIRDTLRPEFHVYTGNDLAIDMVMYGSDYLLGLSTFAPDLFAKRDRLWETSDPGFYELNDVLQYLGFFAFRPPVPAYKHTAAMFLKLRGWIDCDATHPQSPTRPESDREILREIGRLLGVIS